MHFFTPAFVCHLAPARVVQRISDLPQRQRFSALPLGRHPKESAPRFIRTQGVAVQGKVLVRRDAGQVVAGDAVTNIENYVAARPSRCVPAVAFFSA
jgi:hypothetical protein